MTKEKEIFKRAELLMGEDVMEALASKRVIVFGVGGVGSLVLFLQVYVIVGQFCAQHIERCVQVGFLEHSITWQYECHHQQNYDV